MLHPHQPEDVQLGLLVAGGVQSVGWRFGWRSRVAPGHCSPTDTARSTPQACSHLCCPKHTNLPLSLLIDRHLGLLTSFISLGAAAWWAQVWAEPCWGQLV